MTEYMKIETGYSFYSVLLIPLNENMSVCTVRRCVSFLVAHLALNKTKTVTSSCIKGRWQILRRKRTELNVLIF